MRVFFHFKHGPNTASDAQVRLRIGLTAAQHLLATSKLVVCSAWLPLTRELLSVSETEGENRKLLYDFLSFSPSVFCFAKSTSLVRWRQGSFNFFVVHWLTSFEPRDYRVFFVKRLISI